jgi:hypothetical protein
MRFISLEELAERWTAAHTFAVAAWIVVLVLGIAVFFKGRSGTYPTTDAYNVYAAENATFTYPANWQINNCVDGHPFIELPGNIKTKYKNKKDYKLTMYGTGAYTCVKGRPERLDIYHEDIVASDHPCAPGTSTEGERLPNGLFLQLQEEDGEVVAVDIKQNSCFAPADTVVLGFAFTDPKAGDGDTEQFGPPRVAEKDLLKSRQYQDIRTLAQSIRY